MIPWEELSCALSAAALYLLGKGSGRDAEALRSVTRVNQIKDLAVILENARKVLPLIVTISGRVGSKAPIHCEHSGLRGVIVEETAEQHFLKHNESGSWTQDSALILSMNKEVPWYLDDGTGHAYVVGARGAAGFALSVASEVFEESGRSLVRGTLEYLQGLKMLGIKRVERVLPTGTTLTVVGEAVKDDVGTIRIQRPHKGPFYVSPKNIDQQIAYLGKWARWCQLASMGFTVFGVYLLAKRVIQYILERKRRWKLQKRVLDAAAQRQTSDKKDSHELKTLADNGKGECLPPDICVVCLEQEYNAVFVPLTAMFNKKGPFFMEPVFDSCFSRCGHMCCCTDCSTHLTSCPLCRRKIDQAVRTFRH